MQSREQLVLAVGARLATIRCPTQQRRAQPGALGIIGAGQHAPVPVAQHVPGGGRCGLECRRGCARARCKTCGGRAWTALRGEHGLAGVRKVAAGKARGGQADRREAPAAWPVWLTQSRRLRLALGPERAKHASFRWARQPQPAPASVVSQSASAYFGEFVLLRSSSSQHVCCWPWPQRLRGVVRPRRRAQSATTPTRRSLATTCTAAPEAVSAPARKKSVTPVWRRPKARAMECERRKGAVRRHGGTPKRLGSGQAHTFPSLHPS